MDAESNPYKWMIENAELFNDLRKEMNKAKKLILEDLIRDKKTYCEYDGHVFTVRKYYGHPTIFLD